MAKLRVLFIGGSGVISSACSRVAVDSGIELFVLNRGHSAVRPLPPGVTMLRADIREPGSVRDELGDRQFDAVVDWVAFTPEHVRADIEARQVTDQALDAVMDKLAAAWPLNTVAAR